MSGPEVRRSISQLPRNQPPPTLPQPTHLRHLPHHHILRSRKMPRLQISLCQTHSPSPASLTALLRSQRSSTLHPPENSDAIHLIFLPTGPLTPNSRSVPPQPRSESSFPPPPPLTNSLLARQPRHLPQPLSSPYQRASSIQDPPP